MADANSIRIIYIFEACARLRCQSEIQALATHIYHRFFRIKPDMSQFELHLYGSACILLAHRFFERELDTKDLAMIAASIVHGPDFYLSKKMITKVANSINLISLVISINTNFEISFKDEQFMTPGDFLRSVRAKIPTQEIIDIDDSMSVNGNEDEEEEEEEDDVDRAEYLLTNNSKNLISSHRYLTHYLYSIRLLVDPGTHSQKLFNKLCNIAWTFLNDFHWSPAVLCHRTDHIACACLMMAAEFCLRELQPAAGDDQEEPAEKEQYRKLLGKKWNLILCDDLSNEKCTRTISIIMKHYAEYEQIFRKEFTKDVMEP